MPGENGRGKDAEPQAEGLGDLAYDHVQVFGEVQVGRHLAGFGHEPQDRLVCNRIGFGEISDLLKHPGGKGLNAGARLHGESRTLQLLDGLRRRDEGCFGERLLLSDLPPRIQQSGHMIILGIGGGKLEQPGPQDAPWIDESHDPGSTRFQDPTKLLKGFPTIGLLDDVIQRAKQKTGVERRTWKAGQIAGIGRDCGIRNEPGFGKAFLGEGNRLGGEINEGCPVAASEQFQAIASRPTADVCHAAFLGEDLLDQPKRADHLEATIRPLQPLPLRLHLFIVVALYHIAHSASCRGGAYDMRRGDGKLVPCILGGYRVFRMKIIGLAGTAGSGKSAIGQRLAERRGVAWIDLDRVAWATYAPGGEAYDPLCQRFGEAILVDGHIDRTRLARAVFGDSQARCDLEAIVHPAVMRALEPLADEARSRGTKILLVEGAVMASSRYVDQDAFDAILWLDAPEPVRRDRLRNQGREEHMARSRKPFPDAEVLEIATEGSLGDAIERVWAAIQRLDAQSS